MLLDSHRPLDLVAVLLGTNDPKARFAVSALEIALSAERLVAAVRASDAGPDRGAPAVLLIALPPILDSGWPAAMFAGGAAKSAALGAAMAEVAARQGVAFLDAGAVIVSDPLDGIHWSAESHARLGAAVAGTIARHWP